MVEILRRTPAIPENCQWCIFLRNHDELTLEMVTEEERQWMWEQYAPEPRMKLNLGIRRRLAPLLDNDRRKIELINSLLFTLPGSPIIYYGDEIGMGDAIDLPDRNGVRTLMQWEDSANAGFTSGKPFTEFVKGELSYQHLNVASQLTNPNSLFHAISNMIKVRKEHHAFGRGSMDWLETDNPAVAAYFRKYEGENLLIFNNLSNSPQTIALPSDYQSETVNLLTGEHLQLKASLTLGAYSYLWLK
jgi:maltose alpha-D-glucosyltransferase/alpha-amylase